MASGLDDERLLTAQYGFGMLALALRSVWNYRTMGNEDRGV